MKIKYRMIRRRFSNIIKNGGWVLGNVSIWIADGDNAETCDNKEIKKQHNADSV